MEYDVVGFQNFKINVIELTGLERDALHVYVGIAVFLLSLFLTRPFIRQHLNRLNLALLMATFFAFLGEYLDLSHVYPHITGDHLAESIHDIVNTCFWPVVIYAVNRWTSLFNKPL